MVEHAAKCPEVAASLDMEQGVASSDVTQDIPDQLPEFAEQPGMKVDLFTIDV